MKTLVYKRTHTGDPNAMGWFGINDCMGQVRTLKFESVIGIGGIGEEAVSHGIDRRVNWIGIGAEKAGKGVRGPLIRFDRFVLFEKDGPNFQELAPTLAHHIYYKNVRVLTKFTAAEQREIDRILDIAKEAAPSAPTILKGIKHRCPKCSRTKKEC
jgi:hypothetical protein